MCGIVRDGCIWKEVKLIIIVYLRRSPLLGFLQEVHTNINMINVTCNYERGEITCIEQNYLKLCQ